jgi:arginine exporter protein ArgO
MIFLAGVLIGIASAIPPGPIGSLALARKMSGRQSQPLTVVLSAAVLDVLVVLLVSTGLTKIIPPILPSGRYAPLATGVVLTAMALWLWRRAVQFHNLQAARCRGRKTLSPVLTTIGLYFSSPTILPYWTAVTGAMVARGWLLPSFGNKLFFALGVGGGTLIWFWGVFRLIDISRPNPNSSFFRRALQALAMILFALGVYNIGLFVRNVFIFF